jgi:site-specific DNA-cytosine methylase
MRILKEVKPKYFLLENVEMGEKWEKVLSKAIGVNGIHINSALVSAQNRKRIFWTNIGMQPGGLFGDLESIIQQPKDKGILLKDILETEVDEKYYLSQQRIETMLKSERSVPYVDEETKKFNCLLAGYNKIPTDGQYVVHNTMPRSSTSGKGGTGHLSRSDGKTYCLDTGNTNAVEYKSNIRRLTPIECERLQTVGVVENNVIFALCYESAKNYVNAVGQNPKLLKLVLSAENSELNELVKNVLLNMNANCQSIKHTAPQNVDMQTQKETKKCTNLNQEETSIIANNVEMNAINQLHKEMDFATSNVFISLTEGKIIHCGLEEFPQNEQQSTIRKNGNNQLKMCGKEIMQAAEDVVKNLNTKKDNNSIFITSHLLSIKNLEQSLIIYYLFARNVITGYTQNKIQIKNLSLNFSLNNGYTAHVSDSQRYRMLGNGWTVDVIAHIFSYLNFKP